MTQDMKKDMILHTIAKLVVPLKRTMTNLHAHWESPSSALRTVLLLLMMTLGATTAWGQDPVEITTDANGNGTIEDSEKKFYLIQTNGFQSFYMAPQDNNTITTNNILGEYMLWYFLDAEVVGGTQYYYIVNNSTGKYICHGGGTANTDASRGVTLVEKTSDNEERCKFYIELNETNNTPGWYNIDAKGKPSYFGLNKRNGSQTNQYPIRLTNDDNNHYINDFNSKWKFIRFNGTFTWPDPPFTTSNGSKHYYEIQNYQKQTYYASTDDTPTNVTFTNQGTDRRAWYFKEASSDTWFKYYYIVNPATGGKYMYYTGTATNGSNQTNAVSVETYTDNSENEDRYQFVVVQAARGDMDKGVDVRKTCYAIIPKLLVGNLWSSNSLGRAEGDISIDANMGIINSRGATSGAHWDFKSTAFPTVCGNPVITFDRTTGKATITTTTSWSKIYYTTDGTTPSSTDGTLYNGPFVLTEQTTVKAIVTKEGYTDSEVTTKTIYKVATPTIQQETGTHNISITTTTPNAKIYYTTDGTTIPTTSSTQYTGASEELGGKPIKAIAVKDGMINSDIGEGEIDINCATPVISYNNATSMVSITCETEGSTIHYTTNGDTPTASSIEYTPFSVTNPTTVKAIATHATLSPSAVAELVISKVVTPTIQNNGSNAISITTTTPDATIYYTTDGSTPTTSSTVYSSPLTDNVSSKTIKAIAVKENMITSAEGSGTVVLKCATPVITRNGLTFTLSCSMPTDATLTYTLGGGPEMTYLGTPVSFTTDQLPLTVTAVARHSDYTDSETASMELLNGTGTPEDPYLIYGTTDLNNFVTNVNNGTATSSACYKLCFDVSASDMANIAAIDEEFTGTFDGGYHTISGLSHPLFNTINGGTVKNVVIANATVSGNGAICNEADGATKIYNCGVLSGTISGSGNVGGLVGHIVSGSSVRVVNCYNFATVSGGTGTTMAGIVGKNEGTVGNVRIAMCMMYGNMSGGTSPVYAGNHVSNASNFTEYNYWRSKADLGYTTYNDQLAIDKDEYLTRFPFYRHILNTHRELAAYFLFAENTTQGSVGDISQDNINEIGHWVLDKDKADYPIIEKWETNTRKVLDAPAGSTVSVRKGEGAPITSLKVKVIIGSNTYTKIPGTETDLTLPITDIDEENYDYTWGKVVLPFANEFEVNTDYTKICTGWKITGITGGTEGHSFDRYDVSDRDCTSKDLYSTTGFIFAQGGNYIVPYNVTGIEITANFATAYYLSDASYETGYSGDNSSGNSGYINRKKLGGDTPTTYQEQTVYNTLASALLAMSNSGSTHEQAVVLIGNYHQDSEALTTSKGYTIMSIDADNNQEPDYAIYSNFTTDRPAIPPTRFDFVAMIPVGMSAHINGSKLYPNIPIFKPRGWFELTETSLLRADQFELESNNFNTSETDTRNYRCIINGGYFTQMVRGRFNPCTKVSYFQIGGNAYVKEFYPGNHSKNNHANKLVPINVTGGEVEQCFMTGYGLGTAYGTDIYFWCAGGKIGKFLGAYMEKPRQTTSADGNVNLTAKIDHAIIGRFFGGGTSPNARVTGDIKVTINNSRVDFYCGGPEFGDMANGKTVRTEATNTYFKEYYGAGFGGTGITYTNDKDEGAAISNGISYKTGFFNECYVASGKTDIGRLRFKNGYGLGSCYKFEFVMHSRGHQVVSRFFTGYAKFSLATTGSVTNILNGCEIENDFYGAGCQGKVNGTVTSELTGCTIHGSAFGGGFKAESNQVDVYPATSPTLSTYNSESCLFSDFGTVAPETYEWVQGTSSQKNTSDETNKKLYTGTDVTMTDLGNVTGAIRITVDGGTVAHDVFGGGNESKSLDNTTVIIQNGASISGDVYGAGKGKDGEETVAYVTGTASVRMSDGSVGKSVYGGGQLAQVGGDTEIEVTGGTIGVSGSGGATYGNVYGGGKGSVEHVEAGLIKGNTKVKISQADNGTLTTIYHNIYGGGAYGSVGDYNYDATTGLPTSLKVTGKGKTEVYITGGTIGDDGVNDGMVFGSSRGDVDRPGSIYDQLAWVYDTHVAIGDSTKTGSDIVTTTPLVKGSVYGGGENGHNLHSTYIRINGGTIGINSDENVTYTDPAYSGKAYDFPYRGNVYGGGCGTDKYFEDPDDETHAGNGQLYNPLAGIVKGDATVRVTGGHVVHNVYGAGAMGSIGATDNTDAITSGGTTAIAISGGTVGVDGNGNGNVYGAARGDILTTQTNLAQVLTTGVTISSSADVKGSVYGGGEAGPVLNNATVNVTGGSVGYNVYGGGNLGSVGTFSEDPLDGMFKWTLGGSSTVIITGGMVGPEGNEDPEKGNVFGAGEGKANTFKCEKAMVRTTSVSVSDGTVNGNVYGGGKIGRVEENTVVTIGRKANEAEGAGTGKPTINGNVYGAGRGAITHGYSALVRGNTQVTVEGDEGSTVAGNVYGGGEIASVGRYGLDAAKMPEILVDGGICEVKILGNVTIGPNNAPEDKGNIFGAGKGYKPTYVYNTTNRENNSKRMVTYDCKADPETGNNTGRHATGKGTLWDPYDDPDDPNDDPNNPIYVWEYFVSDSEESGASKYETYLKTLALATQPHVIISGDAIVNGSVFGGGELGLTKGSVYVNILDGTIVKDVYGGGSLADSNTTSQVDDKDGDGKPYPPVNGVYEQEHLITVHPKTYVNLLGGRLRNAYGGGLGVHDEYVEGHANYKEGTPAYVHGDVKVNLNGLDAADDFGDATTLASLITGDNSLLEANGSEYKVRQTKPGAIVERIFGCNNLKGSPWGHVKVHVFATQNPNTGIINTKVPLTFDEPETEVLSYWEDQATAIGLDPETIVGEESTEQGKINLLKAAIESNRYDVKAVYGGGNLAPYEPDEGSRTTEENTEVIIDGCNLTSIQQVYGGGNAAPAPATYVQVNGTWEIEEVFGGGNGNDPYTLKIGNTDVHYLNPGANVGYYNYTHFYDSGKGTGTLVSPYQPVDNSDATTKEARQTVTLSDGTTKKYMYGSGVATVKIYGGKVHYVYGGSNKKGNVSQEAVSVYEETSGCPLDLDQTYGGGKDSEIDATINMGLGCVQNMAETFGGSKNADVNSDIVLNITNGTYGRVFGGNNTSGNINGSITVNIYEDGCSPIRIGELYLGGYLADYSIYGYKENGEVRTKADYEALDADAKAAITVRKDPRINVISATRIDKIFGGGYEATVVGSPHVNVNMEKGRINGKYNKEGEITVGKHLDTEERPFYDYTVEKVDETTKHATLSIGTIGTIYGGGNKADIIGNTYVEIGTGQWIDWDENGKEFWKSVDADDGKTYTYKEKTPASETTPAVWAWYDGTTEQDKDFTPTPARNAATITGNVYGGGKGETDHFECKKAMVGVDNESDDLSKRDGGTSVIIANGTVGTIENGTLKPGTGNVYGGGEIGRVERNTMVTIGLGPGEENGTKTPIIEGCVFGAGSGKNTHGYSALVRGNSTVTVQGNAWVKKSVYGGGEIASVGKYTVNPETGLPTDPLRGGICTVTIKGWAEIGPDNMQMTATGGPNDTGYVFGACKGTLPYDGYDDDEQPYHLDGSKDAETGIWVDVPTNYTAFDDLTVDDNGVLQVDEDYLTFINTLALATSTEVTIGEHAFVKGSVYGGSENGHVQANTHVTIQDDCQIGNGEGKNRRYTETEWSGEDPANFAECAHWPYGNKIGTDASGKDIIDYLPYDVYKDSDDDGTPDYASDGHTFYGNVFGGGSGYFPYHSNKTEALEALRDIDSGYADGLWHYEAGSVGGNTVVDITGGHILTSVYGGNEQTDVTGTCTINMSGGTVGVPRTVEQMKTHPVTCYVFGAGKGDQRINFNTWTNVASTQVNISGSARIYGSTFGGGEDGHVIGNAVTNIGEEGEDNSDILIGTTGTSGVDGNIFGGGRGFSETALTAGVVGGNVTVNIYGGTMLGSVFGGGRLASVGTYFADAGSSDYGTMQPDVTTQEATFYTAETASEYNTANGLEEGDEGYKQAGDEKTPAVVNTHGYIHVNIFDGEIGAIDSDGKLMTSSSSIGDVYGGSKGSPSNYRFGLSKCTDVTISGGTVNGNVYGGGELGSVGKFTVSGDLRTFDFTDNTGICNVSITGATALVKGNVFGAGKGNTETFECEKAMAYKTIVSISNGTVKGSVYGGGEVGRLENGTKVTIGDENQTEGASAPVIEGDVFGAGQGQETHGYSALVRGDTEVTIQGVAEVKKSIYGGGEKASVGRYRLDDFQMPSILDGGGKCTVLIQGHSKIGTDGIGHVFGAGQGVTPDWFYDYDPEATNQNKDSWSKRMMRYSSAFVQGKTEGVDWDYYDPGHTFIWDYFTTEAAYTSYLETLALVTEPDVTITGDASVTGDVYGGGERGVTKGGVTVKVLGGTIGRDVYGGGALANTNTRNWDATANVYSQATGLVVGESVKGLYTSSGNSYTLITADDATFDGSTYYRKGKWADFNNDQNFTAYYTTNVVLKGGSVRNVYGGGLGQSAKEAVEAQVAVLYANVEEYNAAKGTELTAEQFAALSDAEKTKTPAVAGQAALNPVEAKVYGDVLVKLNEPETETTGEDEDSQTTTTYGDCVVKGDIFGCNNLNGSPQRAVTVHIYKTEGWTDTSKTPNVSHQGTESGDLDDETANHSYHVNAVYGGGNQAAFRPDYKATCDTVQPRVIIDGCELTSIKTVYGGGNAASTPATNILINGTYEIEEVFGGGNGYDKVDGKENPGANVGYTYYDPQYDPPASSKIFRTDNFGYGLGEANVKIVGGRIHRVFGGSNTKGNVRKSAVTILHDMESCEFVIDEAYGGGKNAPMDADARLLMSCIPGLSVAYGGAQNADIEGKVELNITNGTFDRVFGGNNVSGTISGPITVNVEETGCRPLIIGELFGGGNKAPYSVYGYNSNKTPITSGVKKWDDPTINVKSFTSIGNIYGGGYGEGAVMYGNPTVNIDVAYGDFKDKVADSSDPDYNAPGYMYDENGYKGNPTKLIDGHNVIIPRHDAGKIGAIQNVFGGGSEAKVEGSTFVNIGTKDYVSVASAVEGTDVSDLFIRTGEGTTASPYVYTSATAARQGVTYCTKDANTGEYSVVSNVSVGDDVSNYYIRTGEDTTESPYVYTLASLAEDGTTYYMPVIGVDIRGNVYGGGNAAEVTGNTNVVIGKETATP